MALQGKGWFIWQIPRAEGGSPAAIAEAAVSAGLTHVLIKVAERTFAFGLDASGRDLVPPVAAALRARGIQVWGWHYVYGDSPAAEAAIAVQRANQLELEGYVIDAEAEYKQPGKSGAALTFMSQLRAGLPDTPLALSSYRYPSLHSQLPWSIFLERCDLSMPQVYWEQAHNPDQQLVRCVSEYANPALVGHVRPVVPTGSAYGAGSWRATPEDLVRFLAKAVELGLEAANLYSWDYARSPGHTDLWEAVAAFRWPAPAPRGLVEQYIAALNAAAERPAEAGQLLQLYQAGAGHVTSRRAVTGREAIADWYADLLENILPRARFELREVSGTDDFRHFHWTASGPTGRVVDGRDTWALRDALIQYHYTYFTLRP